VAERIADIERARDAVRRESWAQAYQQLVGLDHSDLRPEDLEALADAAWWLSKIEESIFVRQRAYSGYAEVGSDAQAAGMAARLAVEHFLRGEPAVGAGWLMRAQRHAQEVPESPEHGLLLVVEATVARFSGDLEGAMALADRANEIGQRFGDSDLLAMATHTRGLLLIAAGNVRQGVALLDEAMTSVVAGELSRTSPASCTATSSEHAWSWPTSDARANGATRLGRAVRRSRPSLHIRGSAGSTGPRSRDSRARGRTPRPRPHAPRRS
jgi:hypothetical protein